MAIDSQAAGAENSRVRSAFLSLATGIINKIRVLHFYYMRHAVHFRYTYVSETSHRMAKIKKLPPNIDDAG
jgi:hypothetical protein